VATAVRLLAGSTGHISIVGAGRVGYYAALYIAALGNTDKISICDNIEHRAESTAMLLRPSFPELEIITSHRQEAQADVVVLATDSHQPIYGSDHKPASLVVSVGADTHWQHEVSERLLGQVDIYVDTLDSFNCGDMRQWNSEDRIEKNKVTDLLTLLREQPELRRPGLFISTGSALFDNLTIDYLLENEKALTAGL